MKITVFTLANVRPDFIELQYASIKKFVKDADVEYIVFNNAYANKKRSSDIESICRKLGVKSIKVPPPHPRIKSNDASAIVGKQLNYIWKNHLKDTKDILCCIDSDMFFIKDTFIERVLNGFNFAFVCAYRGKNFEVLYPWTGLMFFNMNTLPHPHELTWQAGPVLGQSTDVGGLNHFYLEKYKDKIKVLYIEFLNLQDIVPDGTDNKLLCNINGNILFEILFDERTNTVKRVSTDDPHISDKKSFPYQVEKNAYHQSILDDFLKLSRYLDEKEVGSPKPVMVDFFRFYGQSAESSFVFHYKSGSNYSPIYTKAYNIQKTRGLYQLLYSLGVVNDDFKTIADADIIPRSMDMSAQNIILKTKRFLKKILS